MPYLNNRVIKMVISKKEWEAITDEVHPWYISDEQDNATNRGRLESLYELYDKAKKAIDPEYCDFNKNTNELLIDLHESSDEIQTTVLEAMNSLESTYKMLLKLSEAMPDSLYEEIDV